MVIKINYLHKSEARVNGLVRNKKKSEILTDHYRIYRYSLKSSLFGLNEMNWASLSERYAECINLLIFSCKTNEWMKLFYFDGKSRAGLVCLLASLRHAAWV